MIQRKDLLTFQFYKKEKFTGSFRGMRYLIQKKALMKLIYSLYTSGSDYIVFLQLLKLKKQKKLFLLQKNL